MAEANAVHSSSRRWESLENWSRRLFILGGGLLLIGGTNDVLIYFAGMSNPEAVSIAFLMGGLLGLAGLYPQLADQTFDLSEFIYKKGRPIVTTENDTASEIP